MERFLRDKWLVPGVLLTLSLCGLAVWLLLTVIPSPQEDEIRIALDEYVPVTLAHPDSRAVFALDLEDPAYLEVSPLFPPAELLPLVTTAATTEGEPVDLHGASPLPAGKYRIAVESQGVSPTEFPVKVVAVPSFDPFEPNDTEETASQIDLPFSGSVMLSHDEDLDWFTFDVPGPGVVHVRVIPQPGFPAPEVVVHPDLGPLDEERVEEQGVEVVEASEPRPPESLARARSGVASRYFESLRPGVWRLVLSNSTTRPPWADRAASQLDVTFFPDSAEAKGLPSLVALGTSPDHPSIQQVNLMLRAAGRRVLVTNDAAVIADAIRESATPTPVQPRDRTPYLLGGLVILAAILAFWWIRRRTRLATHVANGS